MNPSKVPTLKQKIAREHNYKLRQLDSMEWDLTRLSYAKGTTRYSDGIYDRGMQILILLEELKELYRLHRDELIEKIPGE